MYQENERSDWCHLGCDTMHWMGWHSSNTVHSYLGDILFEPRPGHHLSDWGFSWFSLVPLGKCNDSTSIRLTTTFFQILSKLSIYYLTTEFYIVLLLTASQKAHIKKKPCSTYSNKSKTGDKITSLCIILYWSIPLHYSTNCTVSFRSYPPKKKKHT